MVLVWLRSRAEAGRYVMAGGGYYPNAKGEHSALTAAQRKSMKSSWDFAMDEIDEEKATLKAREARFAADCKEEAARLAASGARLRAVRGHLILDNRLLLEHWWALDIKAALVLDPTCLDPRRGQRPGEREYIPIDDTELDLSVPYAGCMVVWGPCSTPAAPCEWCTARYRIVSARPHLVPGTVVIQPICCMPVGPGYCMQLAGHVGACEP